MSQVEYTDADILEMLRDCKERYGKCSPDVFRKDDAFCSVSLVAKRFGTWSEAKAEAGVDEDLSGETGRRKTYSDEQILSQLHELGRRIENGEIEGHSTVSPELLREQDDMVTVSVVIERFKDRDVEIEGVDDPGGWLKAKKLAGLKTLDGRVDNPGADQEYTEEELLGALRECAEEHEGDCPQRAFDNSEKWPASGTVRKRFGTWSEAKVEAGIKTAGATNSQRRVYSDDEMLEMLRECKERYGKCTAAVFASDDDFPSPSAVQRRYGTWNDAKNAAFGED